MQKTLYELTESYPELTGILVGLGFVGVGNPALRNTHGKVMTIPKGAEMMGKDLDEVIEKLEEAGFSVKR